MSAAAMTSGFGFCAENLAEQILTPQPRDVRTLAQARAAVIQAFGQTLSGSRAALTKALLNTSGVATAGGASLVFGTERRTSALDAALINATAALAGSEVPHGAANAACIVALFGLCEERQKTGQEFVDALISGAKASHALAPTLSPTGGQFGPALFGGVAAATCVLGLSRPKIAAALLMAGMANVDSPTTQVGPKSLMVGLSFRSGLLSALIAEAMDEASCAEMIGSEGKTISPLAADSSEAAAFDLFVAQLPPGADLWDQFERQASVVLQRDQIAPLFERLETIDKVKDLATVSRLLQTHGAQAAPKKVVFAVRGTHEPEETTWVP